MRRLAAFTATLLWACAASAGEPEHLPDDVRMPVRVGVGYSWGFDDGVAALGFEGVFAAKEIVRGVRPEISIGFAGAVPGTVPVTLPDANGKTTTYGFHRGHLFVSFGVGLRFGGDDGIMVAVTFAPSATLGSIPGRRKDENIGTVGAGLAGRVELFPWYVALRDAEHERTRRSVGRWIASAFGVWFEARHDWADPERGGALSGGLAIDLGRAVIAPIVGN